MVQLYSPEGRWLEHWGAKLLNTPMDVALDEYGNLFVADTGNHCIRLFSRSGEPVASWGSRGFTERSLLSPCSVAVHTKHHPELCTAQARGMRVWDEAALFPDHRAEKWKELREKGYDVMWDDAAGDVEEGGDGENEDEGSEEQSEHERSAYEDQAPLGDPSNDDDFDTLMREDHEPRLFIEPLRMLTAPQEQLDAWVVENSPLVSRRLRGIGRHLVATGITSSSSQPSPRRGLSRSSTLREVAIHGKDKDPYSALSDLAESGITPVWPSPCDCDRCIIICDGGNKRVLEWTLFRLSGEAWKRRKHARAREQKIARQQARREARRRNEELLREADRRQREAEESREARLEQLRQRASKAARAAIESKGKGGKDHGDRQVGLLYITSSDPISGTALQPSQTGSTHLRSADAIKSRSRAPAR